MIGFLAAGFIFNGLGFNLAVDLTTFSDLGIALLLFFVGLKLDIRELIKPTVISVSITNILINAGFLVLGLFLINTLILDHHNLNFFGILLLAIALSFSSTVFAVKALDAKGDVISFHGKLVVSVLIIQDIVAAFLLAFTEMKFPTIDALFLLLIFPVKFIIFKILDNIGHDELLILFGLFLALVVGYGFFESVGIKGELGALILGALINKHPKCEEIGQALFSIKEFLLIGFFLTIGINSNISIPLFGSALVLTVFLIARGLFYFVSISFINFRSRTALFSSITLMTYSEFSLIVVALGTSQGLLSPEWLTISAIAVSLSFLIITPIEKNSEIIYERYHDYLCKFEESNPKDKENLSIKNQDFKGLVIGMGRIGTGAFEELQKIYKKEEIIGVEHDEKKVNLHRSEKRNVVNADAGDLDFWKHIKEKNLDLIILAMPKHRSNIEAAKHITNLNIRCKIYAVARFDEEVSELDSLGVYAFNIYAEAGVGLAKQGQKI